MPSFTASAPARPRRRAPGPAPNAACAALVQRPPDEGSRRLRTECLELLQRASERRLVVGLRERERGLVRRVELAPRASRAAPVAGELRRVRIRDARQRLIGDPGPPAPGGELADNP